mmetsp:Transcript_2687/g.8348  ORF Transcript_2687/g.8348 Transcript_2687/m.8348 type:complete len:235 (-) Transcript_2687:393-1097(-)
MLTCGLSTYLKTIAAPLRATASGGSCPGVSKRKASTKCREPRWTKTFKVEGPSKCPLQAVLYILQSTATMRATPFSSLESWRTTGAVLSHTSVLEHLVVWYSQATQTVNPVAFASVTSGFRVTFTSKKGPSACTTWWDTSFRAWRAISLAVGKPNFSSFQTSKSVGIFSSGCREEKISRAGTTLLPSCCQKRWQRPWSRRQFTTAARKSVLFSAILPKRLNSSTCFAESSSLGS